MKRFKLIIASCLLCVLAIIGLSACSINDKKYFDTVGKYSFWDNQKEESIAQYKFYDVVDKFLSEGEIVDGKVLDKNGKIRKVLYVGWDGVRADAMTNLFFDQNSISTNGYNYYDGKYSGLHSLKQVGGLYMAYSGGEKGKPSQQSSSTCASWTSQFTGGWNTLHGVVDNNDIKKAEIDTIFMKYAKLGLKTSLAFDWGQLFDLTLRQEILQKLSNPNLPIVYCDIDRKSVLNLDEAAKNEDLKTPKDLNIASLEAYNAVANDSIHEQARYDIAMRDYLLQRIQMGDVIAGGIFHRPDTNGHTDGFSNSVASYVNSIRNADVYLFDLLQALEQRQTLLNEEWLVIATTDHGGSGNGHGKQVFEHRTTWIACNKDLTQYFGKGYNGYTEN